MQASDTYNQDLDLSVQATDINALDLAPSARSTETDGKDPVAQVQAPSTINKIWLALNGASHGCG